MKTVKKAAINSTYNRQLLRLDETYKKLIQVNNQTGEEFVMKSDIKQEVHTALLPIIRDFQATFKVHADYERHNAGLLHKITNCI